MRSRGLKGEFTDACEGKSCTRSAGVEPRTRPQKASRRSLEVSENRTGRNLGLGALPALSGRAWGSLAGAPEGPRAGRFQHLGELRPSPDPAGSVLRYQALALLPRSQTAVFGPRQGRNRPLHPSPEACLPKLFEHKHPINHKTAGSFPGKTIQIPPLLHPHPKDGQRGGVGWGSCT